MSKGQILAIVVGSIMLTLGGATILLFAAYDRGHGNNTIVSAVGWLLIGGGAMAFIRAARGLRA
jgi:hypothetical protein